MPWKTREFCRAREGGAARREGSRKYTAEMILASAWSLPGLLALAAYVAAALMPQRMTGGVRIALVLGWLAHAASIVVDTSGAGSPESGARFGFAPALSATLWLVIAVYLVESRSLPLPGVRRSLAALGLVAVALALL